MRKAHINIEITRCSDCPYLNFDEYGDAVCDYKERRTLPFESWNSSIPDWCPFLEKEADNE